MNWKVVLKELDKTEERIIFVLMSASVSILFIQVITRYLFAYSFPWGEQLARIFFVWVTMVGISMCGKYGMHITIDVLKMVLPEKVARVNDIIAGLITVFIGLFLSYLIFQLIKMQVAKSQMFSTMPWLPVWTMYVAGALGMAGLAVRTTVHSLWPLLTKRRPCAALDDGPGEV